MKIWVTVRSQARSNKVEKTSEGEYVASVHAPAREGKANMALVALLADYFSVPKSSVRIVRGYTARRKLIVIE